MFSAKLLISAGFSLIVLGVLVAGLSKYPWLFSWFGRLPGDIRYESEKTFIWMPLTSMLLLSAVLSGAGYLFRLFRSQ